MNHNPSLKYEVLEIGAMTRILDLPIMAIYFVEPQVNQKMLLMLTASIMYWSLQKAVEEAESSPSPADTSSCSTITDASPAPSINGEDEISSLCGEVSVLSFDDAASDSTVSSLVENEVNSVGE